MLCCRYGTIIPKPGEHDTAVIYSGMYNLNDCKNRILCREAVPGGDWFWLKLEDKTKSSRN